MIVNRKTPNDHQIEGFTFHPGAQFVPDQFYRTKLENNSDFKAQVKARLMSIEEPPEELSKDLLKPGKDGKLPEVKKSLAETVVALSEERAIAIIRDIVDGKDLKEIIRLDKRSKIVEAAEKQIEERQGTMDGMAPKLPKSHPGNMVVNDPDKDL
jgi:hypothetical protein